MPAIFIVFALQPELDAPLEQAVKAKFPDNSFAIGRNHWLVAAEGTAREISNKLGITSEPSTVNGSAVVFTTAGYYGRASSEAWEWIAAKLGGHIIA